MNGPYPNDKFLSPEYKLLLEAKMTLNNVSRFSLLFTLCVSFCCANTVASGPWFNTAKHKEGFEKIEDLVINTSSEAKKGFRKISTESRDLYFKELRAADKAYQEALKLAKIALDEAATTYDQNNRRAEDVHSKCVIKARETYDELQAQGDTEKAIKAYKQAVSEANNEQRSLLIEAKNIYQEARNSFLDQIEEAEKQLAEAKIQALKTWNNSSKSADVNFKKMIQS